MGGMIVPSCFCSFPTLLSLYNQPYCGTPVPWMSLRHSVFLEIFSLVFFDSPNTSWNLAEWIVQKLFLDQWLEMKKPGRSFYQFWVSLCLGKNSLVSSFFIFHIKALLVTTSALGGTSHLAGFILPKASLPRCQWSHGWEGEWGHYTFILGRNWEVGAKVPVQAAS